MSLLSSEQLLCLIQIDFLVRLPTRFSVSENLVKNYLQCSFTDEVVNKQRNIYKGFKFVSVVKNL